MDTRSFVIGQLALLAWREGNRLSPGCEDAMLAIAFIIRNRVKGGWQNSDWLRVLEAIPVHAAEPPEAMFTFQMPDPWHPLWKRLLVACGEVYDGTMPDGLTRTPDRFAMAQAAPGGDTARVNQQRAAFFYANMQQPVREWFTRNIVELHDAHPRIGTVGNLTLFG